MYPTNRMAGRVPATAMAAVWTPGSRHHFDRRRGRSWYTGAAGAAKCRTTPMASAHSSVQYGEVTAMRHPPRRTRKPPDIATTALSTTRTTHSTSIARTQRGVGEGTGVRETGNGICRRELYTQRAAGIRPSARSSTAIRRSISAPKHTAPTGPAMRAPLISATPSNSSTTAT